jgi:citrate lyase beta subunit
MPISQHDIDTITARLDQANAQYAQQYPGPSTQRQPVHTVYGGANLYKAGTPRRLGDLALQALAEYAPDYAALRQAFELPFDDQLAYTLYQRIIQKLQTEPIEDFRIDFEDGYGIRPDETEDADAQRTAHELAQAMAANTLPPWIGIRIKSFAPESITRSIRTLNIFLSTLTEETQGHLPEGFMVTLPKVYLPEQVATLADLLDMLEQRQHIEPHTIALDLMIESPQAIIDPQGKHAISKLISAGRGRVQSVAFGTYDYTASLGIAARYQEHAHPATDFARQVMQASLAGTPIRLSDGITNTLPIGPHRAKSGELLNDRQQIENREIVHHAWQIHYQNIRYSLRQGFYQSWDLHPAQLPVRYAALYSFYHENLADAAQRLNSFINKATQASLVGNTFDDAATGQGLLNFFLRGLACGALSEDEVLQTGITLDELHSRSFSQIAARRAHN